MSGKSPVSASEDQRTALAALAGSRDRGEADRARAILLTLSVWTSPRIAEAFSVSEDTVRLWRSDFSRGGTDGLKASVAPGRSPVESERPCAWSHRYWKNQWPTARTGRSPACVPRLGSMARPGHRPWHPRIACMAPSGNEPRNAGAGVAADRLDLSAAASVRLKHDPDDRTPGEHLRPRRFTGSRLQPRGGAYEVDGSFLGGAAGGTKGAPGDRVSALHSVELCRELRQLQWPEVPGLAGARSAMARWWCRVDCYVSMARRSHSITSCSVARPDGRRWMC
jgi:hypothetical protein